MSSATDQKTIKKITSKEKQKKSKNLSINQETKDNSKKIKKTAAKANVTKKTQTLPQESSNDLKIDLDLEADKLIAEANKGTEADTEIDLEEDDDNASMLSSAQEAACLLYTSPSPRD